MAKSAIPQLERLIGSRIRRKSLILSALTHPSYPQTLSGKVPASLTFQRLEFLGDSVLNYFVANRLFQLFPDANEGLLSRMRSTLVSRKLLARVARTIQLRKMLLLGKREGQMPSPTREKILADAFEALLAALYFDRGLKTTERFLLKCFKPYFNQKKIFQLDPNSKSMLQEYSQKKYRSLPVYRSERKDELFTAWAIVKKTLKARGQGRTKQEAETQAAGALLKKFAKRTKPRTRKRSRRRR
jgi:ribonuclease III